MSRLLSVLRQVVSDLDEGVSFCLIGGLAVSAWTEPRFTRDVDLAVCVADDAAAEKVVYSLRIAGYHIGMVAEHEITGRMATVRVIPPGESEQGVVVDLLFASSGIEDEVVSAAVPIRLAADVEIPVAAPEALLALKLLSRDPATRPQDDSDIRALLKVLNATSIETTRHLVQIIVSRGTHRGRNLELELRRSIELHGSR